MNKPKYFITNKDGVVAIVYESDKYGRTLVIRDSIDPEFKLEIRETPSMKVVDNIDLMEFISSMIPVERIV